MKSTTARHQGRRVVQFLSAWAFALLITGCANQSTLRHNEAGRPNAQVAAGQGAVAVRVSINSTGLNQYFTYWQQMKLRRVGSSATDFDIALNTDGAVGSATYIGQVPPGEYEILSLSSEQCGSMCISSYAKIERKEGRFVVEEGKLTYLGDLLYAGQAGSMATLIRGGEPTVPDFQRWLKSHYSGLATLPVITPATSAELLKTESSVYAALQFRAPGLMNAQLLDDGSALFTSFSSALRRWQAGKGVVNIGTGIKGRVSAVVPISNQEWVAAGDFDQYRRTTDGGATWSVIESGLPTGTVIGMYKAGEGDLVVLLRDSAKLKALRGSFQSHTWQLMHEAPFAFSIWQGGLRDPVINRVADRVMVFLPPDNGFFLDLKKYETKPFATLPGVMGIGYSADNVLRCRCNKSGFWVAPYESRDDGKTWQDSTLDRGASVPVFKDAQNGFGMLAQALRVTHDGGQTWQTVQQQSMAPWPYLFQPYSMNFMFTPQRIIGTDGQTTLIGSEDDGKTWVSLLK